MRLTTMVLAAVCTVTLAVPAQALPLSQGSATSAAAARSGVPTVVSLGDSFISGEAGRWAGNTNGKPDLADALGRRAYWDTATGESIEGCHRSRSAEVHFSADVQTINLACSGATTRTQATDGKDFKPGIDFYDDGEGNVGQAAMLREVAKDNDVRLVVLSIGGNDLHFSDVIKTCVSAWVSSNRRNPDYCKDDRKVRGYLSNAPEVGNRIAQSIRNIRTAMRDAGYAESDYDILVQTYPSPVASGSTMRYAETGLTRLRVGGCPMWDRDVDWANSAVLPLLRRTIRDAVEASEVVNVHFLDLSDAFVGRRLCERGVRLVGSREVPRWTSADAVDRSEWVAQIRTLTTLFGPYQLQESLHPSYWGQKALQACLALAWNDGDVRGGSCVIRSRGLTEGRPNMALRD